MKVSLFDLLLIYETEVKKNVRNKKKILDFEKHKMEYLVDIKNVCLTLEALIDSKK